MSLLVALTALSWSTTGAVPLQGFLTDAFGLPLHGAQTVTVRLYDDPDDDGTPTAFWSAEHTTTLDRGAFSLLLGGSSGVDLDLFARPRPMWISVDAGAESALVPVAHAPRAAWSARAQTADAMAWTGLTGVPTGFADGVDADRTDGEILSVVQGAALTLTQALNAASVSATSLSASGTVTTGALALTSSSAACPGVAGQGGLRWNGARYQVCTASGWWDLVAQPPSTPAASVRHQTKYLSELKNAGVLGADYLVPEWSFNLEAGKTYRISTYLTFTSVVSGGRCWSRITFTDNGDSVQSFEQWGNSSNSGWAAPHPDLTGTFIHTMSASGNGQLRARWLNQSCAAGYYIIGGPGGYPQSFVEVEEIPAAADGSW
jgi:hypothetical protein